MNGGRQRSPSRNDTARDAEARADSAAGAMPQIRSLTGGTQPDPVLVTRGLWVALAFVVVLVIDGVLIGWSMAYSEPAARELAMRSLSQLCEWRPNGEEFVETFALEVHQGRWARAEEHWERTVMEFLNVKEVLLVANALEGLVIGLLVEETVCVGVALDPAGGRLHLRPGPHCATPVAGSGVLGRGAFSRLLGRSGLDRPDTRGVSAAGGIPPDFFGEGFSMAAAIATTLAAASGDTLRLASLAF